MRQRTKWWLVVLVAGLAAAGCRQAEGPGTASRQEGAPLPAAATVAGAGQGGAALPDGPDVPLEKALSEHGLEYRELVTGEVRDGTVPVVIAVHGLGDRPDRFEKLFEEFPAGARFIIPQGVQEHGNGYSWFETRVVNGVVEDVNLEQVESSAARLALLAQTMQLRYPGAPLPVITGFSQGGILAFTVATHHPESVRAAFPLSGLLPPRLYPTSLGAGTRAPKIRAFHGEADRLVPFRMAQETVHALQGRGFDASLRGYAGVAHRVSFAMRRDLFDALEEAVNASATPPTRRRSATNSF